MTLHTNKVIVGMIMCAFRGWGSHLPNARTGTAQYQAEFQIPDGPLTNAAGFYLWLTTRDPDTVPVKRRGYFDIYRVLRLMGVQRGSHAPQHYTGARRGEEPQEPIEAHLVVESAHGNVVLTKPGGAAFHPARSNVADRIRHDYTGMDANGVLIFAPEGYTMGPDAYCAHLHQITGATVTARQLGAALHNRLPTWKLAELREAA